MCENLDRKNNLHLFKRWKKKTPKFHQFKQIIKKLNKNLNKKAVKDENLQKKS